MDETELRNVSDDEIERRKRVDVICDNFEQQWEEGNPPSIEGTLGKLPEADQRLLFQELLRLEIELHQKAGKECDREVYRKRFPDKVNLVDRLFASANGQAEGLGRTVELKPNDTAAADSESVKESSTPTKISGSRSQESDPTSIDRFTIHGKLGVGGFGIVYLATDPLADRDVAIKVPKSLSPTKLEMFLEDARTASQLAHPGIVRIYEVSAAPLPYVVQEYLPGGDIERHARRQNLSPREIVELMIPVAEAVGFAHQRGYTHLDLKPDNILLREDGQPCVVDFGLAVHESGQWSQAGRLAGTVAYMSPEQAAGEVHRIDGRSDIWSLGVIFYELLVEKRPFTERPTARQLDEIRFRDPRPIRQHRPDLPRELWRIIQCCLAKSVLERYQSTADLVDDLKQWLLAEEQGATTERAKPEESASPSETAESTQVIPQGLRSFEAEHAQFYLSLLPGPHDRDGLPSRVRFWKKQIEQPDADETFSVGLMYGPSGCGKSSLVKAGLLPKLDRCVTPVYLEATANDTEVRLIKGIRKALPDAPDDVDLPGLIASVRKRQNERGDKLLIVIDQFEQWLHAHSIERTDQLVKAMRQCDGAGVQCVVLVRDDFWMSATNFMRALDLPLTEGFNSAPVDLFDLDHARHVLRLLGIAYGKLPPLSEQLTEDQEAFVDTVVRDLASNDKVVCVRLAVFAEMMKGRVWNRDELERVGGAEGVGISFLNETFNASHCPPAYRRHRKAIRSVLEALLPNAGLDIKGRMKSYDELRRVTGYVDQVADFDEVLTILDGDTRLITPTEPDGADSANEDGGRFYQLAHDFLVPSLRDWLTREKKETWRGCAELRLAERAELWRSKREDRQLPSMWEYGLINLFLRRSKCSSLEQEMMRRADRVRGLQVAVTSMVLLGVGWGISKYRSQTQAKIAENHVEAVIDSQPEGLGAFIDNLRPYESYAEPLLKQELTTTDSDRERLHIACALSELGVHDFEFPMESVGRCDVAQCRNIVSALMKGAVAWRQQLTDRYAACDTQIAALNRAAGDNASQIDQLKTEQVRLAIVGLHLNETAPAIQLLTNGPDPSGRTLFIATMSDWHGDTRQLEGIASYASGWPIEKEFDFLSGVVLSLGDHIEQEKKASAWMPVLARWFQESKSGGVHSACGLALRKAGVAESQLTTTAKNVIRQSLGERRDWDVTDKTDLTLVRIPASNVTDAFWISDREITVELFFEFVKETEGINWQPPLFAPNGDDLNRYPAQNVSWINAAKFCNWLSEREGLKECYRFEQIEEVRLQVIPIEGGSGYRLPSNPEWTFACAAGTGTEYFVGRSPSKLESYACVNDGPTMRLHPEMTGLRMCNPLGLFDVYGNVQEWCWPGKRTLGGSFFSTADNCRYGASSDGAASPDFGLRVIRQID